jgi:uncharacterized protein (DUF488 family)
MGCVVYTLGHSTRSLGELMALLKANRVNLLVDVRFLPGSRRHPQFDRDVLERELPAHGIAYRHHKSLGGRRRPRPDSINQGWRNDSFRGYADYMQTGEWKGALDELIDWAHHECVAIMCAEAVPWRCHRSLIADGLVVRGVDVRHITGPGNAAPHALTSFAHVEGDRISYPGLDTLPFNG